MDLRKLFRRRTSSSSHAADPLEEELKQWRIIKVVNEASGERLVLRLRMTRPFRPDVFRLNTAIVMGWPYESTSGMPPRSVNEQQLAFERALDPLSEGNDNSELVQVGTGVGLKEWVYYARSREIFMTQMNELLAEHPRYPLNVEFYDDPGWRIWEDTVRKTVRKRDAEGVVEEE